MPAQTVVSSGRQAEAVSQVDGSGPLGEGVAACEEGRGRRRTWPPWALTGAAFLLAAVMFFARLGGLPLIDPDEGRNAEVARVLPKQGRDVRMRAAGIEFVVHVRPR